MKRILLFTNTYDEKSDLMGVVPSWVRALREAGADVRVIAQQVGDDRRGVTDIDKRHNPSGFMRLIRVWGYLIRERATYDVLFVAMAPMWAALLSPVARFMGKRVFLWYAVWRGTWKLRIAEKLVNVVVCSVPESFPFRSSKVHAIGQAIDTERFAPDPAQRKRGRILALGRISPVKRLEVFIRALEMLSESVTPGGVVIAGAPKSEEDKHYETELRNRIRRAGLEQTVAWIGMIPFASTPGLYRQADIAVNMTPVGSFDKTMLEAMASGALLVASNPSLRSFLPRDVADALMFRQGDAADMARVLDALLEMSEAEKDALRDACREAVRAHHSIRQWATRLLQVMA